MPKTVSIFAANEGHLSLGYAAKQAYGNDATIHFNLPSDNLATALYRSVYRFFPKLNKVPFELSKREDIQKLVDTYTKLRFQNYIAEAVKQQRPDIIISTHFLHNNFISQLNTHNQFKFFNIISDPRTISPVIPHKNALNLVFDKKSAKILRSMGIPKDNTIISGWFVRDEFESKYNQINIKKELKLEPNITTLLVVGGSEGTNHILKTLPAFLNLPTNIQIVFACGSNGYLHSMIQSVQKISKTAGRKGNNYSSIIALPFTNMLHKYMQAADLVIGKAGPNLLFESVATHTPFLAITHISGQEDGNLSIIKDYKLGYLEENPLKLPKLLKKIINKPKILKDLQSPIHKLADHNRQAKQVLRDLS